MKRHFPPVFGQSIIFYLHIGSKTSSFWSFHSIFLPINPLSHIIIIIGGDFLFTEQLLTYLKAFFKRNNLPCPNFLVFNSGEALLANTDKKDIVFLDIEMPGLSGISTGQELKNRTQKS